MRLKRFTLIFNKNQIQLQIYIIKNQYSDRKTTTDAKPATWPKHHLD